MLKIGDPVIIINSFEGYEHVKGFVVNVQEYTSDVRCLVPHPSKKIKIEIWFSSIKNSNDSISRWGTAILCEENCDKCDIRYECYTSRR
jgi:hypothetical protein